MSTVSFREDTEFSNKSGQPSTTLQHHRGWEVGNRYKLMEILGKGSYGQVIKALDRKYGNFVAIKQMKHIFDEPIDAKRAYREIHILRHLKHPSIVTLFDVISTSIDENYMRLYNSMSSERRIPIPKNLGDLYLVFEFVDTDLSKIIKSNQYLSAEHIQYILYQILDGLKYIHMTNVIHRDLKPANILISCNDCMVKIADFGLSRVVGSDLIIPHPADHHYYYYDAEEDDGDANVMDVSTDSGRISLTEENWISAIPAPPAAFPGVEGSAKPAILTRSSHLSNSFSSNESHSDKMSGLPPPPLPLRRGLTRHVITRWYRAPEVVLLQPYTAEVDVWSIGCIFAELLGLVKENFPDYRKRRALFPGESCGELSAEDLTFNQDACDSIQLSEQQRQLLESYNNNRSQLNVIFEVIGTPREDELSHLDQQTAGILRGLARKQSKDFSKLFPASDASAISLLKSLLQFNPELRITAAEAVEHPYFNEIKKKGYINSYRQHNAHFSSDSEGLSLSEKAAANPVPLNANIEKVSESDEYLKQNIIQEVLHYRRKDQVDCN